MILSFFNRTVPTRHRLTAVILVFFGGSLSALSVLSPWPAECLQPLAQAHSPEVIIYLNDGTDVTGTLHQLTPSAYVLSNKTKSITVPLKKYQGMVLNIEAEKKASRTITTNPAVMMAAARYNYDLRQKINAHMNAQTVSCNTKKPLKPVVAHFQILKSGTVRHPQLLLPSHCPSRDKALLNYLRELKPGPLPADYTPELLPGNFVYPLPAR